MRGRDRAFVLATGQVAAVVVLLLASVPGAVAATAVSGDKDSNAPLVIDPSSDPSDPLETTKTPGSQVVMLVQEMPVTKLVDEVTIGDLAVGPGCSATTATAKVYEYADGDPSGSADAQFYSTGSTSISASPAKLTWSFPPILMREGHAYAFSVAASGCSWLTRRTWAHNYPLVNPGPERCAGGPLGKRMWHEEGVDDAVPGCVDKPAGSRTFDPFMPTGWLISQVSQGATTYWDVSTASSIDDAPPICYTRYPPNTYEEWGGAPVFWYQSSPSSPEIDIYSCQWTQWADFGDKVEHGWYYAFPWLAEAFGEPRDMYLELGAIDYDALLSAYAPILAFDEDENFYPQDAGAFSDFADPPPTGYELSSDYVNILYDELGEELAAAGSPGPLMGPWPPALTLSTLGEWYVFGPDPEDQLLALPGDYIDARGSSETTYAADSASQYAQGYDGVIYGRVVHDPDDGQLWLQYRAFYYFNSYNVLGVGYHEGDWEMIQVGLSSGGVPQKVTFAAHDYAYRAEWSEVTKGGSQGISPVVFVAARSHASYPEAGETPIDVGGLPDPTDSHQGDGLWETLPLAEVSSGVGWTGWPGRWGSSPATAAAPSPVNPSEQGSWTNPSAFHSGAVEW